MLVQIGTLFCVIFSLQAYAQIARCPTTFPAECSCEDTPIGPKVTCITIPLDTWDIKSTFDEISDTINDNSVVIYRTNLTAIPLGQAQEIPAHAISTLKTTELYLDADFKLTRIDPEAFSGFNDSSVLLALRHMNFANSQEAVDLLSNLKRIQNIDMFECSLDAIPAHSLADDLVHLTNMYVGHSQVRAIGDNAFAGPPILRSVSLYDNNLQLEEISNLAFNFTQRAVILDLQRNSEITHLPQEIFGIFLIGDNSLFVGPGSFSDDPNYFLHCDERADWLCGIDYTHIYNYYCKETDYVDLADYCEQRVENIH